MRDNLFAVRADFSIVSLNVSIRQYKSNNFIKTDNIHLPLMRTGI